MQDAMARVTPDLRWGITALADDESLAQVKVGFVEEAEGWVVNSSGRVIVDGGPVVISVMTDRNPTFEDGVATIEEVARLVGEVVRAETSAGTVSWKDLGTTMRGAGIRRVALVSRRVDRRVCCAGERSTSVGPRRHWRTASGRSGRPGRLRRPAQRAARHRGAQRLRRRATLVQPRPGRRAELLRRGGQHPVADADDHRRGARPGPAARSPTPPPR